MSEQGGLFDGFEPPPPAVCPFCGEDASEPDHWEHCDGRQGRREADDQARADRLPSFEGAIRGHERRDRGHERVDGAIGPEATAALWAAWRSACERHPTVTSDDFYPELSDELRDLVKAHPNKVGAMVRASSGKGRRWVVDSGAILHTGRAVGQGRRLTVWRSLVYEAA